METPLFALRLPQKLQDDIRQMSKDYGSPNPRAFVRELLETVLSGDMGRVQAFNVRLIERVTGQLQLRIEEQLAVKAREPRVARETRETRVTRKTRRKRKTRNERTT